MNRYHGRTGSGAFISTVVAATAAVLLAGCGQGTEESDATGEGETRVVGAGEVTGFQLDNGITVYLREDHLQDQVAVEVIYRAGVIDEPKGSVHVSRVLPHMLIFSPTASFGAGEAVDTVGSFGRINGEVIGEFTRFEYAAPSEHLELLLQIEAERLTSVVFTEEQLERFAKKCVDDLDHIVEHETLSLSKYGLMAFNQAYDHGLTSIPIRNGVYDVTIDDLEQFRRAHYRLADMVIAVTGDFDTPETTELITKHFGGIEEKPRVVPAAPARPDDADMTAYWDIPSNAMFLVYPGPYEDETERLVLTMFGKFLARQLNTDADLARDVKASLCSSTVNPVGNLPFFVFVQIRPGRTIEATTPSILSLVDQSIQLVDQKMFDRIKTNLVNYLDSSILDSQRNIANLSHSEALSQEALEIGAKHYLRNGATKEEFIGKIRSITFEDAKRYIDNRLAPERRSQVVIREQ